MKQVSRCPPLRYGAQLSSLAMSGLAFSVAPLCHVIQMLWLLYVSVGLAHAPAPMNLVLLFAWLATSWDAFSRYRIWLASWLAGWSHAGRVCLSDATCARDQRKSCSRETIVLYPLKWTNRLYVTLCYATSPPTYPARKYGINHKTLFTQICTPNSPKLTV